MTTGEIIGILAFLYAAFMCIYLENRCNNMKHRIEELEKRDADRRQIS